ncbi:MAG TPA: (2Fe-2S)-binding protein [Acidimicrobiales bacterium]|nr:(2Fe-2S)-binding protein [Acidimicrobiales bacterium]
MLICSCKAVNDRTVRAAIGSGAATVDEVTRRCKAGGGCGGCHSMLQRLLSECLPQQRQVVGSSAA